jgi:transcription elongation factor Elf1
MAKLSFICPKCDKEALSVDRGDSILNEGTSNLELVELVKKLMTESKLKEYRFWRCENCDIYYETDLKGKYLKEFPNEEE